MWRDSSGRAADVKKTKSNLRIIKPDFCTRAVEARFTNEMEKDDPLWRQWERKRKKQPPSQQTAFNDEAKGNIDLIRSNRGSNSRSNCRLYVLWLEKRKRSQLSLKGTKWTSLCPLPHSWIQPTTYSDHRRHKVHKLTNNSSCIIVKMI